MISKFWQRGLDGRLTKYANTFDSVGTSFVDSVSWNVWKSRGERRDGESDLTHQASVRCVDPQAPSHLPCRPINLARGPTVHGTRLQAAIRPLPSCLSITGRSRHHRARLCHLSRVRDGQSGRRLSIDGSEREGRRR